METTGSDTVLSGLHRDLYDHIKYVLDLHLAALRRQPLTGDLIENTTSAYDALDALVEDLKVPQYDLETPYGRLMDAVAKLNKTMPGVALRTLGAVNHYLATSDDDGIVTRQRAMAIIQGVGLDRSAAELGAHMAKVFPPLP